MKQIPRIIKVLEVEPFKIRTLWANGEERIHNFAQKLVFFSQNERWKPLIDPENFKKVAVGEGDTLYWPNIQLTNSKGNMEPLSFDPMVLYEESELVEPSSIIQIDASKEFTLAEYARRHELKKDTVRSQVRRGKLKTRYVKQLNMVLVIDESGIKTFPLSTQHNTNKKAGTKKELLR